MTTTRRKTIAVFAPTLTQPNPRGAVRLFYALAQHLVLLPGVEWICITEVLKQEVVTIYQFQPLNSWLEENPLRAGKGTSRQARGLKGIAKKIYRSLPYSIFVRLENARPRWIKRIQKFKSLLSGKSARVDAQKTRSLISADEIDIILNFWWFHTAHNMLLESVRSMQKTRVISWFLDGIPLRIPHWQPGLIDVDVFKRAVAANLSASDKVIAISHSAKKDCVSFFGQPPEKVSVVPCGVFERDFEPPNSNLESLLGRIGADPNIPILLCIGIEEPSKNIINILKGCLNYSSKEGHKKFQVILVGESTTGCIKARFGYIADKLNERCGIKFTGYISNDEIKGLLHRCKGLVYASLWEGFGIPPLEAMALGKPVIVSDIGPSPEVCGDIPIYCDPYDPFSISQALEKLFARDEREEKEYAQRAIAHAKAWTWSQATQILADEIGLSTPQGGHKTESYGLPKLGNESVANLT